MSLDPFAFICRLVSGTSLVAVVSTALASSYTYVSHGVVDAAAALVISCCAVLTAPLGANLTATFNATVSCRPEVRLHVLLLSYISRTHCCSMMVHGQGCSSNQQTA